MVDEVGLCGDNVCVCYIGILKIVMVVNGIKDWISVGCLRIGMWIYYLFVVFRNRLG